MRQRSMLSIALLVIALATGCAKKSDDAALVTSIQSQMFADPSLKNTNLQVTSNNGEVTLSGTVPSASAHLDAYKIASQTPGVTKVNDQIAVQEAQAAPPPEPAPTERPSHSRKAHVKKHAPPQEDAQFANNAAPPTVDATPAEPPPPPPQPTPAPAPQPPPPPPPQPKQVQIPASTTLTIRMIDGVDSSVNRAGEIFHASLENPIVVDNQVIVSKGADVYVRLVDANSAGKFSGKSDLHLELVKLEFQGQSYPLVSSTYSLAGNSRGKDTATKVGGGAVIGAIIGALAGGGKGAAIGAGVGGAGGGVYQGMTHGKQVKIPSETKLDFQLDQPVTVTVLPRSTAGAE
ncbi:MAG: BON domain-containing protein [Candidatus Acidiferrales bacterium]